MRQMMRLKVAKIRASATDKRSATLEMDLGNPEAFYWEPIEVAACSEADANKARTDLHNSQACLV